MSFTFINRLINLLGKQGFRVDENISAIDMFILIRIKVFQLIRGTYLKLFFKSSTGLVFIGKFCQLKHCNKISIGKTFFLGDYAEINALSKNGITIGNNVSIHRNTIIDCTGGIQCIGEGLLIGNNVGISPNCFIQVRGSVKIGNNVIFGPDSKIFSESHNHSNTNTFINEQGVTRKDVTIEDGVWIGAGATILNGVTVGKNSIIAACSLVNKDVPAYSIVAGIPAKIVKNRN